MWKASGMVAIDVLKPINFTYNPNLNGEMQNQNCVFFDFNLKPSNTI